MEYGRMKWIRLGVTVHTATAETEALLETAQCYRKSGTTLVGFKFEITMCSGTVYETYFVKPSSFYYSF